MGRCPSGLIFDQKDKKLQKGKIEWEPLPASGQGESL